MKILLSGGGSPKDNVALDKLFASQINLNGSVLYIPVAEEEISAYDQCFESFRQAYCQYGITNIEMCVDLNQAGAIDVYTAIYIGGGNTFKLLKEIKESCFDRMLIEYLNKGGFVYGYSAGSIIFGKDIMATTYEDENNVGLADSKGLNLVKGFDICCHYLSDKEYKRKRIQAYSMQSKGTIALPDGCAVFMEDDEITFIGSGVALL